MLVTGPRWTAGVSKNCLSTKLFPGTRGPGYFRLQTSRGKPRTRERRMLRLGRSGITRPDRSAGQPLLTSLHHLNVQCLNVQCRHVPHHALSTHVHRRRCSRLVATCRSWRRPRTLVSADVPAPRPATSPADARAAELPTAATTRLPSTVLFLEDHPLHVSHLARRLSTPCYPRFLGVLPRKPPPHELDGDAAQNYYAFVLGNFRAHRVTPVPEGYTLRTAYEHFMQVELQQAPKAYRDMLCMILDNIQGDHDCKRRRNEERIRRRAERRRKGLRAGSHDGSGEDSDADGQLCDARVEAVPGGSGEEQQQDANGIPADMAATARELAAYDLSSLEALTLFDTSYDEGAYMYGAIFPAINRRSLADRFGEHNRGWVKRGSPAVEAALSRVCARMLSAGQDAAVAAAAPAADGFTGSAGARLRLEQRGSRLVALVEQPGPGAQFTTSELAAGTRPPLIKLATPPTIEDVVQLFTLSEEQAFAFIILADYFDRQRLWLKNPQAYPEPGPPPRVVVVGKPGTGKSQVIHAGLWYTFQHDQPGWFATCAYAWTAALAFAHPGHRSLSTHSMFQLKAMHDSCSDGPRMKDSDKAKLQVRGWECGVQH